MFEIARASGTGMRVEKDAIIVRPEARRICEFFGIDPYCSISEGSLIITAREKAAPDILRRLEGKGIAASVIGEVTDDKRVMVKEGGEWRKLEHPVVDPFWAAFSKAMQDNAGKSN